ncbi:hypothetical protein WA1_48085 [Scytonema hofmannii PCC 7110]|uniref:Uncharacterized protein n=1 Tax=Scytonema hofmannii PCC 7110 TaxID=128403 RepID=A0A139WYB4_9CYAN|nr:hypothetical protein [Scytonema hofmannii]KYC37372.1 hypothetical protein WA1_48085 [Scytonema hofmannii PCC 7110]
MMRYYKSGGSTDFVEVETSQEFKQGDIVEAAIANKKNVEVTYKLPNSISLTQKEHKKANFLSVVRNSLCNLAAPY